MTISDIITMLSLIIALVAIINEKNRRHLLLKFSKVDFLIYIIIFFLINYFVFYDTFYSERMYLSFLYFKNFGLEKPQIYAYIISILFLISVLIKINNKYYPYGHLDKVINYYKSLIANNETQHLIEIIERYHLKDIINYINESKDDDPNSTDWMFIKRKTKREKIMDYLSDCVIYIFPRLKYNRIHYSKYVLYSIIDDPAFISLTSNVRPYFFAEIICTFKKNKRDSIPYELVNNFLYELIKNKNFWLIKELKQSENFDSGQPQDYFQDNKLIASLIKDVSVADVNEVWKPFGERAILEIENEKNEGKKSKLFHIYRNDEILWEYETFIAIKFIDRLLIEAIAQDYKDSNFYISYYWHITEKILENLQIYEHQIYDDEETNYHHLILEINDNLFHWLKLTNEHESPGLFHDVLYCLGQQIHDILLCEYFGKSRKEDLIERFLRYYCNMKEHGKTNEIRDKMESILLKPCMLTEEHHPYYSYLENVWVKFDKVPHRIHMSKYNDMPYFSRLKEKVIIPLGLDTNIY